MHIFNTTDLIYKINYLSRSGLDADSLQVTNEATNVVYTYTIQQSFQDRVALDGGILEVPTCSGDYLTGLVFAEDRNYNTSVFEITSGDFVEDNFYFCKVLDVNSAVIFQDKIFVTDQTIAGYTINNAEYTQNETTNEYIIYE